MFHEEEVNLVYKIKEKETNKQPEKPSQKSTKKVAKGKKVAKKKDMSGFGCKDTLISGMQDSAQ